MSCLSLPFWETWIIRGIVFFAIVALLRLLISAMSGAPYWPVMTWPPGGGAPGGGFLGFVAAALEIVLWAIIAIALVSFIFALIGCLMSVSGLRLGA